MLWCVKWGNFYEVCYSKVTTNCTDAISVKSKLLKCEFERIAQFT